MNSTVKTVVFWLVIVLSAVLLWEVVKQGAQCVKVWASGGGLHENEPEDVQHYSLAELRVIVEEANYARVPVAAVCSSARPGAARPPLA